MPGMRHTRQRQLVWDAARQLGGHCTADQITARLQAAQPGFPKSTVYRALDALAASGALHAVRLGDGPIHYEVASEDHQHAICQVCQGVMHIETGLVDDLVRHLQESHRFTPLRTEVVVVGVCEGCSRAAKRRKRAGAPGGRPTLEHVHR
jgi:Fe2+ or Zn2+ uptake regulation protein